MFIDQLLLPRHIFAENLIFNNFQVYHHYEDEQMYHDPKVH